MKILNMHNKKTINLAVAGAIFSLLMLAPTVQADDVEVYLKPPPEPLPPNILFILDESGSMDWNFGSTGKKRVDVLKAAMHAVIYDPKLNNVNAAIMGYRSNAAHVRVIHDFVTMDTSAHRDSLQSGIDGLITSGGTPSVYALERGVQWMDSGWSGKDSPLDETDYCAANSIVFLTDGSPNSNNMTSYKGTTCDNNSYAYGSGGRCAQEIADYAENKDFRTTWAGEQNVVTHTVSMLPASYTDEQNFLRSVAREGHGFTWDCNGLTPEQKTLCLDDASTGFYQSDDAASLADALKSIVESTLTSVKYSFNTPVIPVNPSDAASSGDWVYIPMLVPDVKAAWKGNLKKYKLGRTASGAVDILDANGASALNKTVGSADYNQFLPGAQSYWDVDTKKDGNDPLLGGVVEKIAQFQQIADIKAGGTKKFQEMLDKGLIRKLYTYLPGVSSSTDLTDPGNSIIPSDKSKVRCSENTNIVPSMLDVGATKTCHRIMKWLVTGSYDTGLDDADGNDIIEYKMGAPIHTKPVVINYGGHDIVFLPASDGILHAFDGNTGDELWGYMPEEMLFEAKNIKTPAERLPIYGLDGEITVVHNDINENYTVDAGEKVMLVFGQRRGGKNYYAIDVTNYSKPKFVYQIKGGAGDFAKLAQTWSQAVFTTLDWGTGRDVLIFGGGYDVDQDAAGSTRVSDDEGNVIYVVDAWTGNRLKEIHVAGMDNSIPARISVMDLDSDGMTDRIYAADVGGRIIRADIKDTTGSWTAGVIADVGGSPNIKFFNQPTIAFESGGGGFLAINVGTGNRSKPLEATKDTFYMIKDRHVWDVPTSYPKVTKGDLFDIPNSDDVTSYVPTSLQKKALKAKEGWKFDLPTGVKVFSRARVLDYVVVFTTYSETDSAPEICKATSSNGHSELYALNMLTGGGVFEDSSGVRLNYVELSIAMIPPSPVLVGDAGEPADPAVPGSGRPASNDILVGLESAVSFPPRIYQLNWEEVMESAPTK